MGWLITLGILFLLAILPLGVSVRYDAGGPLVRILAGPVRFTVVPAPKKKQKKAPEKESAPKKQPPIQKVEPKKTEEPAPRKEPAPVKKPQETVPPPPPPRKSVAPGMEEEKPAGGSWTDFLPLVKTGLDFLGDFRRKLRLNVLELKLILAGGDPCNLAINYGRAWAAVGNLMPQLDRLFVIKKRDVEVECDFTASTTTVIARLDITITLGRLIGLAVGYGIRGLKEFLAIKKKRKGGAVT